MLSVSTSICTGSESTSIYMYYFCTLDRRTCTCLYIHSLVVCLTLLASLFLPSYIAALDLCVSVSLDLCVSVSLDLCVSVSLDLCVSVFLSL